MYVTRPRVFWPDRQRERERERETTVSARSCPFFLRLQKESEITREQLSLPLASPPSPSGIRGILWVVQSIDLWLVSRPTEGTMKYSDRRLAGLSAGPPDRPRRTHRRGLFRLRDRPQLRLRANKLPSPNHFESRDFLLVFKNLSHLSLYSLAFPHKKTGRQPRPHLSPSPFHKTNNPFHSLC